MSIPFPPVRVSSGSVSSTTFGLRRLLHLLTRPAIPLELSLQVSPSGWAGGDFPILIGFSFHQPFRRPIPDAPQGSSVEVTVRPRNLWMQVQKSSKCVDFTKAGAESGFSKDLGVFQPTFAQDDQQKERDTRRFFAACGKSPSPHRDRCPILSVVLSRKGWESKN